MSSGNIPPSNNSNALADSLERALNRQQRALNSFTKRLESLVDSSYKSFDPITNLTSAFKETEKLQLQSLSVGTTYSQFLAANTESMKGLMSSNLSLSKFLISGFGQGLRDVSDETIKLADQMNITGQDNGKLAQSMASLRFLTGNSVDVTRNLSKTIIETTRESGVSNTSLIQAIESLSQNLFDASIYGQDAVGAFAEVGVLLKGGLAGAPGADKAINVLLGMQNSLNVAQQEQLGLRQFFQDLRSGQVDSEKILQQILGARDRFNRLAGENDMTRDALAKAFGTQQVRSLLLIANGIENFEGTSDEMKASAEKFQESMKAFEEAKKATFETYIPEIHSFIVRYLPALALGQVSGRAFQGATAATAAARRSAAVSAGLSAARGGASRSAVRAAMGAAARGAVFRTAGTAALTAGRLGLGLLGGPIGLLVTAASIAIPLTTAYLKKTAENTEESAKLARQELSERKREQLVQAQADLQDVLSYTRSQLRSAGMLSMNNPDSIKYLERMEGIVNKMAQVVMEQAEKNNVR